MNLNHLNILIVEDNEDNSLLAAKILNYYGFPTTIVTNGQDALNYCDNHFPSLILMDLSLPDLDGREVARRLKNQEQYKHIPIIALTAHAMRSITKPDSDFDELLTKPFLPEDLMILVRKYLS
jgi:CheY-like chemotaxis protein